jgi:hypothetical protein
MAAVPKDVLYNRQLIVSNSMVICMLLGPLSAGRAN